MAQFSTAMSDFVLALTSVMLIYHLQPANVLSVAGMAIQLVAASLGVFAFGLNRPSIVVIRAHGYASWLAIVLGTALMSAGFHQTLGLDILVKLTIGLASTLVALSSFLPDDTVVLLTRAMSGFSLLSLVVASVLFRKLYLLTAAVLYIVGGAMVGSRGAWVGIPRVDILHYFIALANCVLYMEDFTHVERWL